MKNRKVYVSDLQPGKIYRFNHWFKGIEGLVQYVGSFQHVYEEGDSWKKHRFLWVRKPTFSINQKDPFKGKPCIELYGESIRGTLSHYNEKEDRVQREKELLQLIELNKEECNEILRWHAVAQYANHRLPDTTITQNDDLASGILRKLVKLTASQTPGYKKEDKTK